VIAERTGAGRHPRLVGRRSSGRSFRRKAARDEAAPDPANRRRGCRRGAEGGRGVRRRDGSRAPRVPRLIIAIERVGGAEAVRAALAPKMDEKGQPLKWAAVCCDAAQGLKPGDPLFLAWIRLAGTPVRTIKQAVADPEERRGGGRGGPGRPGDRGGGDRGRGGGGDRGGRGGRDDRGPREDRPSRQELAQHAKDGVLSTRVRIVTDDSDVRRERERKRKEEREAKRQAERERLQRLGY
jgi:uncharacterized protein